MIETVVDIESLGTAPGCCIVAIGAAKFDLKHGIIDEMYVRPEWQGRLEYSTVRWWLRQEEAARDQITRTPDCTLEVGLTKLVQFVGDGTVWGNGADFDNAILMGACRAKQIEHWNFRQNRCYRTVKNLLDPQGELWVQPEIPHHALYDARAQAQHLMKLLRRL